MRLKVLLRMMGPVPRKKPLNEFIVGTRTIGAQDTPRCRLRRQSRYICCSHFRVKLGGKERWYVGAHYIG